MCKYADLDKGQCFITYQVCPYLYFCNKIQKYKFSSLAPSNCKIKRNMEIPEGYYQVCFERRGELYIDVNGVIEIIQNPYDFTPLYVKMNKLKSGVWKIKSAK